MTNTPHYYLDIRGDASEKPDCILIESEIDFLQHVRSDTPLQVRGELLCNWAMRLAEARGWKLERLFSPTTTLMYAIPQLSLEQAQVLLAQLGSHFDTLSSPVEVADVLHILAPADLWSDDPTREHAAHWLLWLDRTDPSDFLMPLLMAQAQQWTSKCDEALHLAYAVTSRTAAQRLLRQWLHIEAGKVDFLGTFPISVPDYWVSEAYTTWSEAAVRTDGGFYAALGDGWIPSELQTVAAKVAYTYFKANITQFERVNPSSRARLRKHLTSTEIADLTRLKPPVTPSPLPEDLSKVLHWFTNEYLPYRHWQAESGDPTAAAQIAQITIDYAHWLLRIYPEALHSASGTDYGFLSIACARQLRTKRDEGVTFWIILDGMLYSDAQILLGKLETEPRLARETFHAVLSPLPTITRFCKPALMNGTTQTALDGNTDPVPTFEGAELLRRDSDPAIALQYAKNGKIYVWSLVEPDASYHQRGADRPTILRNVHSELDKAACAIQAAALAVPDHLRLRIVLSTDHGRLLTAASRSHAVPYGMESHGRAAYGKSNETPTRNGFLIDGDLVTLFGSRFDLPCDVLIPLDGNAFRMNNDAGGTEQFAHGGLYPEETIVPWIEILRDRQTPKIKVMVRGKSKPGTPGTLAITLENSGTLAVIFRALTLHVGAQTAVEIAFGTELRGQTKSEETGEIERWFRTIDAERATATATFDLTNGSSFDIEAEVVLSSIEMYQRDNLLEDL